MVMNDDDDDDDVFLQSYFICRIIIGLMRERLQKRKRRRATSMKLFRMDDDTAVSIVLVWLCIYAVAYEQLSFILIASDEQVSTMA